MAVIFVIFSMLVVNLFKQSQTASDWRINELRKGREEVVALEILQIHLTTSEAPPATSSGNNLNVVDAIAPRISLDVQKENFQAISTIYSFTSKKATDETFDGKDEGNVKLLSSPGRNDKKNFKNIFFAKSKNSNTIFKPMSLVWDDCLETNFKDSYLLRPYSDLHNEIRTLRPVHKRRTFPLISENVNKRDTKYAYNSTAAKAWIEKYNNLKNAKIEEKKHQKPDYIQLLKNAEHSSTTLQFMPITKNIFNETTIPVKTTLYIDVTENIMKLSNTREWLEPEERTKIRFGGPPQPETYLIPTLKLEEGFYPFNFMSDFFWFIYPFDFPVGLIKDIVWGDFSFPYSFLQSIKVESTFLIFIVTFACISLVVPAYLIVLGILSLLSKSRCEDEIESGALYPMEDESNCKEKAIVIITLFIVLLCCLLISGMAINNEQARAAAAQSRAVLSCVCTDIATWLSAAARELHHSLVPPVDLVLQAFKEDLNNIEFLLGEPIQQAISSESGVDLVLDSLNDIISESEDIAIKISFLRDVSVRAGSIASAASDRIKDLGRQLENLKKHCTAKDAPLCDTINTNNLEIQMKFETFLREQQLMVLRSLGVDNLTRAITSAKKEFKSLPSVISTQTLQVKKDIIHDVETRRQAVHSSAKVLSDIVRHLTTGLHTVTRQLESGLSRIDKYEFWRWTTMLACMATSAMATALILSALLCSCCQAKEHSRRTLITSTMWLAFNSIILWAIISATFLIAGHAEIYVCHALWDAPHYKILSALLDKPSPLLENSEGIFDALFKDIENVTINVPVRDILRQCEKDQPAYIVFQLDKVLDVNKETSYFEWAELQADLRRLASSINVEFLKTMTVNFSKLLNQMLTASDVDLAKLRMEYNGPIAGKDLPALIDQLENIAAQVADLTTAGRLESLASRTQRLHLTNVKPLEQLRADLVFKLTELELQLMPFRRKLNISLSHIHTAQYYIDNQGEIIAQKKMSIFVSRLISHAAGWRTHVLTSTGKQVARCRPLYSVYSATRALLCTRYVSSLHGWWVSGFFLGILWCTALAPLSVKLWKLYGRKIRSEEALMLGNLSTGLQETPTTALCDSSNWHITGPPPPPRSDSW